MKSVVIDTNLIFSAILKPGSTISKVIQSPHLQFYSPEYLKYEINKHALKLRQLADYTEIEYEEVKLFVFKNVIFINEYQIQKSNIEKAKELTIDIDEKDMVFVALTEELNCKLWTGDKFLREGLIKKGYDKIISLEELKKII